MASTKFPISQKVSKEKYEMSAKSLVLLEVETPTPESYFSFSESFENCENGEREWRNIERQWGEKTAEMTEAENVMSGGGYRGEKENYCKLGWLAPLIETRRL